MTKIFLLGLMVLGFAQSAFSMPCDTGYTCKSKSGKYEIELQRCRYVNSLNLESAKIDHKEVKDATLGPAYDGQSVGGNVLAFEVNLPTTDDSTRVLAVEIVGTKGIVQEKYAESEPSPFKVLKAESMKCTVSE